MTIAMPNAPAADLRAYPLIAALFERHGCTEVESGNFVAFTQRSGNALLLFTEDPARYRETLDLAVIVPEIARAFPGRFAVGVLLPEAARALQPRYGFRRWPALVLVRGGEYVGAIDGLRGWDEYLAQVAALLEAPATRAPSVGITVKGTGETAAGCGH